MLPLCVNKILYWEVFLRTEAQRNFSHCASKEMARRGAEPTERKTIKFLCVLCGSAVKILWFFPPLRKKNAAY